MSGEKREEESRSMFGGGFQNIRPATKAQAMQHAIKADLVSRGYVPLLKQRVRRDSVPENIGVRSAMFAVCMCVGKHTAMERSISHHVTLLLLLLLLPGDIRLRYLFRSYEEAMKQIGIVCKNKARVNGSAQSVPCKRACLLKKGLWVVPASTVIGAFAKEEPCSATAKRENVYIHTYLSIELKQGAERERRGKKDVV